MKNNINKIIFLGILLFVSFSINAQNIQLKGKVSCKNGNPVSNAIVSIKQQPNIKVYTDAKGEFEISGKVGQVIQVITKDNLKSSAVITGNEIKLVLDKNDQLVTLGNKIQLSKTQLTSAVGFASEKEFSNKSTSNPQNALYGLIPGLTVMQNGNIFIRGIESSSNDILVLVDGFEQSISSLSLEEIESVSVLKDAASLAIYGLRGANGVLLVTTKKGFGKKLSVKTSYERGITTPFRLPKMLDSHAYAKSVNQARINDGLTPIYNDVQLGYYQNGTSPYLFPNVNWLNETLKESGSTNRFNISVQQQSKGVRYFAFANYETEDGLYKHTEKNEGYSTQNRSYRLNYRGNIEVDLTSSTVLSAQISGNKGENTSPSPNNWNVMSSIINTPSLAFPIYTENSTDGISKNWGGTSTWPTNPVAAISATGYDISGTNEFYTNFILEQRMDKILKGLSAEATYSYGSSSTYFDRRTQTYQFEQLNPVYSPLTGDVVSYTSTFNGAKTPLVFGNSVSSSGWRSTLEGKLKYSNMWSDNNVKAMLYGQKNETLALGRDNNHRTIHAGANVFYSKADKYLLDLTLAYGATNYLPKGSRGGFFPAVGLGWIISKEDFLKENSSIKNLKLRASWGVTGNDIITRNLQYNPWNGNGSFITGSGTSFIDQWGFAQDRPAATIYTYEKSNKTNIGVDLNLFNKLDLTIDAFYNTRSGIIVSTDGSQSAILGLPSPYSAVGVNSNKGVEIGAMYSESIGDFKYRIGGQFSFVKNEIVEMRESYSPYDYLYRTGKSIGQPFGLEAIGFFADNADIAASPVQNFSIVRPGDIKYKDQNNDNKIDGYDNIAMGFNNSLPELYFSATIGAEYKGFGCNAVFQGVGNYSQFLGATSVFRPLVNNANISTYTLNSWTPETAATATLPRLTTQANDNNYRSNSLWIADASYLKLRSAEVYYNFSENLIHKIGFNKVKVYVRGMDLLSFDKIDYLDPEAVWLGYPKLSSINFGLQLGF